jgi:hypothetical protein
MARQDRCFHAQSGLHKIFSLIGDIIVPTRLFPPAGAVRTLPRS